MHYFFQSEMFDAELKICLTVKSTGVNWRCFTTTRNIIFPLIFTLTFETIFSNLNVLCYGLVSNNITKEEIKNINKKQNNVIKKMSYK